MSCRRRGRRDPPQRGQQLGVLPGTYEHPQAYSRSIAGFPFDVIHLELGHEIFIVAYTHEKRRPGLLGSPR